MTGSAELRVDVEVVELSTPIKSSRVPRPKLAPPSIGSSNDEGLAPSSKVEVDSSPSIVAFAGVGAVNSNEINVDIMG